MGGQHRNGGALGFVAGRQHTQHAAFPAAPSDREQLHFHDIAFAPGWRGDQIEASLEQRIDGLHEPASRAPLQKPHERRRARFDDAQRSGAAMHEGFHPVAFPHAAAKGHGQDAAGVRPHRQAAVLALHHLAEDFLAVAAGGKAVDAVPRSRNFAAVEQAVQDASESPRLLAALRLAVV